MRPLWACPSQSPVLACADDEQRLGAVGEELMIDPIIFEIGKLSVTWFGVLLASGFFAAYTTWVFLGKKVGRDSNFAADLLLWIMVSGILGARIAYILANIDYFMARPAEILFINQGGLIYYGGFIGGALGLILFARVRKLNKMTVFDLVVTGVPIAHFFGRVGCFLNGCCHGSLHEGFPSVVYPQLSQPWYRHRYLELIGGWQLKSLPIHPVQLYEGCLNIALFALLLWGFPRWHKKPGRTAGVYLLIYPLIRFSVEYIRGDARTACVPGVNVAQMLSLSLMAFGAALLLASRKNETDSNSTS